MTLIKIPKNHPRAKSLKVRETISQAFSDGIVVSSGLIAHGRGEAFDYILGEKTLPVTLTAIKAAVAELLLSRSVISVNGNVAALQCKNIITLANLTNPQIEINLFHRTEHRIQKIHELFMKYTDKNILGTEKKYLVKIPELKSLRRFADKRGIIKSDVVFIPLEDGDRAESLVNLGKRVLTVDLNPLSRTSQMSNITIVDNVMRAIPIMISECRKMQQLSINDLKKILSDFDNENQLNLILDHISTRLISLSKQIID